MRTTIPTIFLSLIFLTPTITVAATTTIFNIVDQGARPDGQTLNTLAIQKTIDQCSAAGGGQVKIPAGKFLTGTLYLRNNVDLHLEAGAILLGSKHLADYPNNADNQEPRWHETKHGAGKVWKPDYELSVIRATDAHDISITGEGTINGNGRNKEFKNDNDNSERPRILDLVDCKNVTVTGIELRDGAFWLERYLGCQHVHVQGIHVYSHANANNDGIDMDASDALIEDSTFDTDDDAICLKSDRKEPCKDVVVRNCTAASNCNAIKAGTASLGGFENIRIEHITVRAASEHWLKNRKTGLAGIALEIVDGGTMKNVEVSDITIDGVQSPIFIKLGNRGHHGSGEKDAPAIGTLSDVILRDIHGKGDGPVPSSISGLPGHDVTGIRLEHITLQCPGKGTMKEMNTAVPEAEKDYPENRMFGSSLPAYGLYVRHAKGLILNDVQIKLSNPDERPAMIFDDTEQIDLNSVQIDAPNPHQAAIRVRQSPSLNIQNTNVHGPSASMVAPL
jgi:polygalacturonase